MLHSILNPSLVCLTSLVSCALGTTPFSAAIWRNTSACRNTSLPLSIALQTYHFSQISQKAAIWREYVNFSEPLYPNSSRVAFTAKPNKVFLAVEAVIHSYGGAADKCGVSKSQMLPPAKAHCRTTNLFHMKEGTVPGLYNVHSIDPMVA